MTRSIKLVGVAATVAMAVPALIGVASAAAQTVTVTPAGDSVQAVPGQTTLTAGSTSIVCKNDLASPAPAALGTIPASPGNTGTTVAIGLSQPPGFNDCSVFVSGLPDGTATVSTTGSWTLTALTTDGNPQVKIGVPNNGATITTSAGCTLTITSSTIGPVDYNNTTQQAVFTNTPEVDFTTSGMHCPDSPGTFTGTYTAGDTTNPLSPVQITVNP